MPKDLKEHYQREVVPAMQKQFGYGNRLRAPRIIKVVLNSGISANTKDPKLAETVKETLRMIAGQQAAARKAKKSISNFKVRKGQDIGFVVTLRGRRMYDFLERLINLAFPRVRDFRGINPASVDARGSLSVGFREVLAFPEIKAGDAERQHGLEVTVVTNAKSQPEGYALLKLMGFPFRS